MKKRILSILLTLVMLLSLLPVTAFAAAQKIGDSDVTWELSEGNTVLTLGGTGAMPDFTLSTDIPWYSAKDTITTVKVGSGITRFGDKAFFGCENIVNLYIEDLESWCKIEIPGASSCPFYDSTLNLNLYVNGNPATDLVIPDTITEIKDYAFYCFNNLTSVTIPSSVTSIGYEAFKYCKALTGVTIPTSVTSIGDGAFGSCAALTSVTIPTSVTRIGTAAFNRCTALTSVTIPTSVTSIGAYAFASCPKLASVTIPSSVTEIGGRAFTYYESGEDSCASLKTVTVKATTPPALGNSAFPSSNAGFKVYVPYGTLTNYQNDAKWKLPNVKPYLAEAYVVDDKPTTHGTVAMSEDCFPVDTYTTANETVNVTVTPDKGYKLKSLKYNDGEDHDITSAKSFTMPAANVTVTATFEASAPSSITTWSALQDAITAAPGSGEVPATETTTIKLTDDLTAPATGGDSITIPDGKNITLDLNGHVLNANGGKFHVIEVLDGTLTLIDSNPTAEHYFTVGDDGLWTLTDTKTDKTKTVKGGVITGSRANDEYSSGGGVYIRALEANATFTMNGGTVCGNTADGGGGLFFSADDAAITFNMNGGTICGNTASYGGGVYTFGNTGDVVTFNMNGGTICDNTAEYGGGVLVTNFTAYYLGGTAVIKDNYAGQKASNLVICRDAAGTVIYIGTKTGSEEGNGVLKPADGMVIGVSLVKTDWTEDGKTVYYPTSGQTPARKMTADDLKYFFPDSADYYLDFIDGTKPADRGDYLCVNATITTWSALQDAITAAPGSGEVPATATTTIKLTDDLTAPETGGASITIPAGKNITLDLNGHVLNANGCKFSVITVGDGAQLTLNDSKPETEHYFTVGDDGLWTLTNTKTDKTKTVKGGVITGGTGIDCGEGKGINGGGLYLNAYDAPITFTMNGGTICGNTTATYGGGLYVSGEKALITFTMNGGTICGNTAEYGGGVFISGTSSNANLATFNMNGGTICDNTAEYGGGVLIITYSSSYLGGTAVIKDNYAGQKASNLVFMDSFRKNTIYLGTKTGSEEGNGVLKPADGMVIGVSLVIMDWSEEDGKPVFYPTSGKIQAQEMKSDDLKYFFSDSADYNLACAGEDTTKPTDDYLLLNEAPSVATWSALQDAIDNAPGNETTAATATTTIKLTDDLTAPETGGSSITIPAGKDITLDLNGKVLNANGGAFRVIAVAGALTLIDSAPTTEHYFTVGDNGLWTLTDTKTQDTKTVTGGIITGGKTTENGGGVNVDNGTLNMTGGSIVGNTATKQGGGVYLRGSASKFTMENGSIEGNCTTSSDNQCGGGGVYLSTGAALTMTGGSICNNAAANIGGGVYLNGVEVGDKPAFSMTGGTISGNKADKYGGGIYCNKCILKLTGGMITDNTAKNPGGGVFYAQSTDACVGGTVRITGNKVQTADNDFYVEMNSKVTIGTGTEGNGVSEPKPGMLIGVAESTTGYQFTTNGTENDVKYFFSNNADGYVKVQSGCLTLEATSMLAMRQQNKISITPSKHGVIYSDKQVASSGSALGPTKVILTVIPDNGYVLKAGSLKVNGSADGITENQDGTYTFEMPKAAVTVTAEFEETTDIATWSALQDAINAATEPTTIKLTDDLTADATLTIPEGKNITLDLNGKKLDRGLSGKDSAANGNVIINNGTLTIKDSSKGKTGTITGGNATFGGAIVSNGETTLESGTITGCKATSTDYDSTSSKLGRGGAIYVPYTGKFNMSGGEIKDCSASVAGGAIFNVGTVNITGGKIGGCSVSGANDGGTVKAKGGAVYNFATSHFTMTGGEISGNKLGNVADMRGAGVYAAADANITLGGTAKITGNTDGKENASNLFLYDGVSFTVSTDKAPETGMNVGVTTKTAPATQAPVAITSNGTADDEKYFTSDNANYGVKFNTDHLELTKTVAPTYTYMVTFPEGPEQVYIIGNTSNWETFVPMTMTSKTTATITVNTQFTEYKYTAGADWTYVEKNAQGGEISNRTAYANPDVVGSWAAVPAPAPTGNETELFNPQNASVDHTYGANENPVATWDNTTKTLTVEIKQQGGYQWANQVYLDTGITTLDTTKEYQVSFTATASTINCGGVTFKAFDNNQIAFANQNLSLTTTPFNYVSDWTTPSSASANGMIVFDFGWDPAQTVTITNISIKERTKQPLGAIEPVEVIGGKIVSGDTEVEITTTSGGELPETALNEVAAQINKVLDNETVKNFGKVKENDDTGIIAATEDNNSSIAAALKATTDDQTAKGNVDETNISKYLNVTLVSADVDVDTTDGTTVTVNKLVFDVTPMATITVTGTGGASVTLTTEIENDEIDGTVTFLLPVDKSIAAATAAVYHKGEFLGNFEIKTDGSGNKYIEVTTDSFSEFGYMTLDETTAGAKIGTTLYASLSDAVSEVQDDETIKLLKNASGTITVSRVVKFTVDDNGKTNTATITAGSGYTVSKSGNTYTVSAYSGGGGGGSSSYAIELPANVKNGKIEVGPKNASAGQTVTLTVTPDKGFTLETLTVLDKNGKEVEVKNLGNNKYSFKMPSGKVTISATFMEDNTMLNFFVDVKATDYFYDAVLWAAENGITNGVDAVHFGPEVGVTRAQVVTFLWRAAGCPEPVGNSDKFTDLLADQYYIKAVAWAIEQGITKGTSNTTFSPDMVCTRGQIVTFLARFAGVEDADTVSVFSDVPANEFFAAAVKWAKDNGVTSGVTNTTFEPYTNCNRAQVVTFLYRWMVK